MRTLTVPYISQIDEGRPVNDCGPACALMVARAYGLALDTSIDDLYQRYGWPDDGLLVGTIWTLLEKLGVTSHTSRGGGIGKLREYIEAKKPPILLIDWYGGHFVVATAVIDGGYLINDPYWRGDDGKNIYVSDANMQAIWGPHDQYNYTAIVPEKPLPTGDKATLDQIEMHLAAIGALVDDLRGEDTAPPPVYVTLTRQFNFRKQPNTTGGTWGLMPAGTTFEKIGIVAGEYYSGSTVWYHLRNAAGVDGYAHELGFT